jgi:hypothetical protein
MNQKLFEDIALHMQAPEDISEQIYNIAIKNKLTAVEAIKKFIQDRIDIDEKMLELTPEEFRNNLAWEINKMKQILNDMR